MSFTRLDDDSVLFVALLMSRLVESPTGEGAALWVLRAEDIVGALASSTMGVLRSIAETLYLQPALSSVG